MNCKRVALHYDYDKVKLILLNSIWSKQYSWYNNKFYQSFFFFLSHIIQVFTLYVKLDGVLLFLYCSGPFFFSFLHSFYMKCFVYKLQTESSDIRSAKFPSKCCRQQELVKYSKIYFRSKKCFLYVVYLLLHLIKTFSYLSII